MGTFDADTLASGTTRSTFYLNAGLDTPKVGKPPAPVACANGPRYGCRPDGRPG